MRDYCAIFWRSRKKRGRRRAPKGTVPGGCKSQSQVAGVTHRIMNLSRGVSVVLLGFTLSAAAQAGRQNGIPTLQTASGISTNHDYWAVEDAKAREKLPLYKIIPAARPAELTPANGYPKPETFLTWHRSHGDNGGNPDPAPDPKQLPNITNIPHGWLYYSGDGRPKLHRNSLVMRV